MAQVTPAVSAGPTAAACRAALVTGAATGSMSAFNWAQWEYMLSVTRRKDRWRLALANKVPGSRVMLFDSRPRSPYFKDQGKCEYRYTYGGAFTGRLAQANADLNSMLHQRIEQLAQLYGFGPWKDLSPRWARGEIKLDYYERATRWHMSSMTGSGRLPSGTSLSVPGHSRREGNKSKHGWLSKTPRKSMA